MFSPMKPCWIQDVLPNNIVGGIRRKENKLVSYTNNYISSVSLGMKEKNWVLNTVLFCFFPPQNTTELFEKWCSPICFQVWWLTFSPQVHMPAPWLSFTNLTLSHSLMTSRANLPKAFHWFVCFNFGNTICNVSIILWFTVASFCGSGNIVL